MLPWDCRVSSTCHTHIILFDGVCNLCSASVQFVLKRDSKELFQFCSLQSNAGKRLLKKYGLQNFELQSNVLQHAGSSSMVLLQDGKSFTKSSAALTVARGLRWPWPLLYGFIIVPKFLRDAVYDFIGNRRYRWFGKKNNCWIPPHPMKHRFLDNTNSDNNPIEADNER
ncbi:thiol-disulfide oxidoreductase DCC family protein [Kaarinaea lacus]